MGARELRDPQIASSWSMVTMGMYYSSASANSSKLGETNETLNSDAADQASH